MAVVCAGRGRERPRRSRVAPSGNYFFWALEDWESFCFNQRPSLLGPPAWAANLALIWQMAGRTTGARPLPVTRNSTSDREQPKTRQSPCSLVLCHIQRAGACQSSAIRTHHEPRGSPRQKQRNSAANVEEPRQTCRVRPWPGRRETPKGGTHPRVRGAEHAEARKLRGQHNTAQCLQPLWSGLPKQTRSSKATRCLNSLG